jgi:choice-of-anchor B domain-containing protein
MTQRMAFVQFLVMLGIAASLSVRPLAAQDGKSMADDPPLNLSKSGEKASAAVCENSRAGQFACLNVDLRSHMTIDELGAGRAVRLNDLWGWTDSTENRNYALVGLTDGTAFVDVSDPDVPVYRGFLPRTGAARSAVWRDIKVQGHYAFIVADGSGPHGMQVFDLNDLRGGSSVPATFREAARYDEIGSAHNIVIDEDIPFAFITGVSSGRTCSGGLHMVDISDPLNPSFSGCFTDIRTRRGYSHDAQCVVYHGPDLTFSGQQICIGSNENAISIVDVTDKRIPIRLGIGSYPDAIYVHQGWLTEDHAYFLQDDELDERTSGRTTRTLIWDVSDLSDPVLIKEFFSNVNSSDHNQYVLGSYSYQANYSSGLRILDISDINDPVLVGFFDTYPPDDEFGFSGAWSAYPFFGNGLVLVSSRDEGLFVLQTGNLDVTVVRSFKSEKTTNSGSVRLSWMTRGERDNSVFDVEEQDIAGQFVKIASIPGAGTTSQEREYEITLTDVAPGRHVYRIAFGSESGRKSHSEESEVLIVPGTHVVTGPWPNPTAGKSELRIIVKESQHLSVDLYSVAGRRVSRLLDRSVSSSQEVRLTIDNSDLPGGLYFIRIVGDLFSLTREMVVAR